MQHPRLWARCVHGLEPIVADELRAIGATGIDERPRNVLFSLSSLVSDALRLRTVDDVFVLAVEGPAVGHTRDALQRLRQMAGDIDIGAGPTIAIDVTASFAGRRNYNRYDIEESVGEVVAARFGASYVSRRYEVPPAGASSWRVHLDTTTSLIGMRLAAAPLHRRAYKQQTIPGTLHPPFAAAMVMCAALAPGDRVLDPMAGAGTIAIEAALLGLTHAFAADVSNVAVAASRANASLPIVSANAVALPFTTDGVDAVITNPPWGAQVGVVGRPHAIWREVRRVLRSDGRLIVLTPPEDVAMVSAAGFTLASTRLISLRGSKPVIAEFRPSGTSP